MPEFQRPGVTLHYELDGAGPPLVMIAGMVSDSASWGPLVAPLAKSFTLIRPDNRATGRTQSDTDAVGPAELAKDYAALIDHLGLGPVAVLGHSMGGLVALELAARAPDKVDRAVLLAAAPQRFARSAAFFDALVRIRAAGGGEDLWLRALLPWLFGDAPFEAEGALEAMIADALAYPFAQSTADMARQQAALQRYEADHLALAVRQPVLALLGGRDRMLDARDAAQALAPLAQVTVEVLEDLPHSMHWVDPEGLAARIGAFLAGPPG